MAPSVLTETDRIHLRRAIELGEHGRGRVSPNPVVGALIVRDDAVIGEGCHAELGEAHAEVAALADCRARGADPAGATMYVSLEPCAHHGRQPPCTDAILAARIARVVIGTDDQSDKASGRGPFASAPEPAARLRSARRRSASTGSRQPPAAIRSGFPALPAGRPSTVGGRRSTRSRSGSRPLSPTIRS